jgi:hypothetical protein
MGHGKNIFLRKGKIFITSNTNLIYYVKLWQVKYYRIRYTGAYFLRKESAPSKKLKQWENDRKVEKKQHKSDSNFPMEKE